MRGRGGIGRRAGLKIRFRKECGFDSHRPHQLFAAMMISCEKSSTVNRFLEVIRLDIAMRRKQYHVFCQIWRYALSFTQRQSRSI
jgi:hypothetical protein